MGYNTHLWDFSGDRWENIHLKIKPRHMILKSIIMENEPYSEGFNTHVWHFSGDRYETIHLLSQPRHVTPQINHPRKTIPVLRVIKIHLWDFSGDRWEIIHLLSKSRPVTPQIYCLRKSTVVHRVITHSYGISQEIDGKSFIC